MFKNKVTNTTEEAKNNPELVLIRAITMGGGGAIYHQEAEGQREFVESTTLPTKIDKGETRILESWGFIFGEQVEGDPLFQYVTMPTGWKKEPTDHSMWTNLIDDKGRERAGIFYKAAFYDRSAHLSLQRRYGYSLDYDKADKGEAVGIVTDCGKVIFETNAFPLNMDKNVNYREYYAVMDYAEKCAKSWLDEHYPNWQSPAAYWD